MVASPYGTDWPAPNGARAAPRSVYVELRADNPRVRIDRVLEGMTSPVCVAPCRTWLDAQSAYVITGDGVRSTSRFVLPDDRDAVTLDVRAGSTARLVVGTLLIGGGVATIYIGALVWEASALSGLPGGDPQRGDQLRRVGITMTAIGIPAALFGTYLALTSHTSVASSTGSTFTQAAPPRPKRPRVALTGRGLEF